MKNRLLFTIIILFSLTGVNKIYSQKSDGFELEGAILVSDLEESLFFNIGGKYHYWINPFVGFSVGGSFIYSRLDMRFDSPRENNVRYYLDDNIVNISGAVGLKLSTPTYKGFGLMSDFNFLFEPIPFNLVSVDKKYFDSRGNLSDDKNKSKIVFTNFNPAYAVQLSIFYEIKKEDKRMRLGLGTGFTNYNVYNAYYRAKVDNIRLKDHLTLRPDKSSTMIFLRISGF
jgi:hypothetical protein